MGIKTLFRYITIGLVKADCKSPSELCSILTDILRSTFMLLDFTLLQSSKNPLQIILKYKKKSISVSYLLLCCESLLLSK